MIIVDTLYPGTLYNISRRTMPATTMCITRVGVSRRTSLSHSLHSGTDFSAPSGLVETYPLATSARVLLHRRLSMWTAKRSQLRIRIPQRALPRIQNPTRTIFETLPIYHRYPSNTASLSHQPEKPSSKPQAHGSKSSMTTSTAGQVCWRTKRSRRKRREAS